MNEDMKWLAENVHEWKDGCCAIQKDDYGSYDFLRGSDPEQFGGVGEVCFTRTQWQAARDELSGKPSWDDAPEWAQWLAQDEDGRWFWYAGDKPACKEPFFEASTPVCDDQDHWIASRGHVLGDWRKTLERRPENHSVEPTEKVWRGPEDWLPPVGAVLEAWFDDGRRCWHKAHVVGYHPSEANTLAISLIGDHESRLIWSDTSGIRPVRSEEDKAVEEMVHYRKAHHWSDEQFCRELYRAGYRKQEDE